MVLKRALLTITRWMRVKSSEISSSASEEELWRIRGENDHLRREVEELGRVRRENDHLRREVEELQDPRVPPGDLVLMEDHLRDALEKNLQWQTYDEQRESVVRHLCARALKLEQQLERMKRRQTAAEATSDDKYVPLRRPHEEMLWSLQEHSEGHKDRATRTQQEEPPEVRFSESSSSSWSESQPAAISDRHRPPSPSQVTGLRRDRTLQCPYCHETYPVERWREVLAHVDDCYA